METRNVETGDAAYAFFEPTAATPLAPYAGALLDRGAEDAFLDKFLSAVKWIFLYVPGTAFIHMLVVGFGLSLLYEVWPSDIVIQLIGALVIGTFMVMLGVGKLSDLKYLRVVAGIVAASSLSAILYLILAALIPGDFFGRFYQLSLPFPLVIGYLVKRRTDKTPTAE
jgi:hypothetical protein